MGLVGVGFGDEIEAGLVSFEEFVGDAGIIEFEMTARLVEGRVDDGIDDRGAFLREQGSGP